jgi:hypothetical protein
MGILSFEKTHLHSEENFCAKLLAKEGNKASKSFLLFLNPPPFVVSQLLSNVWGVSYSHVCNI